MSQLVFHGYPDSPFAEKIRTLLGYKGLPFLSVQIPVIMPKPDLTALTGGYRRTPVLQIGADIYCDTALIAEIVEEQQPRPPVFPAAQAALQLAAARWFDSEFFRCCVGLAFQPKALAANERFRDPQVAEAFLKDRAALAGDSGSLAIPLERAESTFRGILSRLEAQLAEGSFLGGEVPAIADFSAWHCCWFIHRQPVLQEYFSPYPAVLQWMERMRGFSAATRAQEFSGSDAVAMAAASEPTPIAGGTVDPQLGLQAGDRVAVMPTDYGRQPVHGMLLAADDSRISVARNDPRAGAVNVHFPRYGFEVLAANEEHPAGDKS